MTLGIGLFALGVVVLVSLAFQSHAGAVGSALAEGLRRWSASAHSWCRR